MAFSGSSMAISQTLTPILSMNDKLQKIISYLLRDKDAPADLLLEMLKPQCLAKLFLVIGN